MNKIKRLLTNKTLLIILMSFLILGIWILLIKVDKDRCEENGGKYIWEWSNGTKCHLKGE